jgi:hypothetical protein
MFQHGVEKRLNFARFEEKFSDSVRQSGPPRVRLRLAARSRACDCESAPDCMLRTKQDARPN